MAILRGHLVIPSLLSTTTMPIDDDALRASLQSILQLASNSNGLEGRKGILGFQATLELLGVNAERDEQRDWVRRMALGT